MLKKIKNQFFFLIEGLIRNISGRLGEYIRYLYYSRRFKSCGKNIKIEHGVIFENPENITLGDDVWFLPFSMVTARPLGLLFQNRVLKKIHNEDFKHDLGEIVIGNQVSIGAYNIIQGYGGLDIKDKVTTSARVSIYSFSHYPVNEENLSEVTYANSMVKNSPVSCIESPIVIGKGAWIGLSCTVFGGTVGDLSFVSANSIVVKSIEYNSYATGNPAVRVKARFKLND